MKTYFIGLGGCGLKTVSEIQKRLRVLPNAEKDYAFTYIDTDEKTYNSINEKEIIISSTDFKNMGDTNPAAVYNNAFHNQKRNANEDRMMEWVISQEPGHMVLANSPLNDGAKAFRNLGRVAIYNKYNYIYDELSEKIKKFEELDPNPDTNTRDVDIWVVASSCGGTGSSNLLDVLYLINKIANPVVSGSGEPNLKLVLFMPQPFVDKNKDNKNYPLNAHACLWELNAFRSAYENGNKQTFERFAVIPTKEGEKILDFPLYKFAIPVDAETNVNSKLNVDTNLYPTIAEMIYYLTTGNGANALCSNLSNDIAHLEGENGQTRSMVGYGFRAIKKANRELIEYLTKRGIYEILNYGLLDKARLGSIKDEKVRFANETILSKLLTIDSAQHTEGTTMYNFGTGTMDDESAENRVKSIVYGATKTDPTAIDAETLQNRLKRLSEIGSSIEIDQIKKEAYNTIKTAIDKEINSQIVNNGLEYTFELLNTVDDFYLEPLNRYINSELRPNQDSSVQKCKSVCDTYAAKGYKKKSYTDVDNALKKYREAVIRQICLNMTSDIINDLTESQVGYLEVLRKGDRREFSGLRMMKDAVVKARDIQKTALDDLAEEFRKTKNDAMTVFLPDLAEIATGPNNSNWANDSFFDQLYQGSILEQEVLKDALTETIVPVRKSPKNCGLTDFLQRVDPDCDIFISIIKDKPFNLEMNVEKKITNAIKTIVAQEAGSSQSSAGQWIAKELKDEIYNPALLSKEVYNSAEDLFNDFKDDEHVPVFFPLKSGIQYPAATRLMYVGSDQDLAEKLGYSKTNNKMQWVKDENMKDRFMIMRMPIGLGYDMYKYYPNYKLFYENPTINNEVRNKKYGCHIHQRFNESNDFNEIISRNRLEELIKCLYYQYVADLLKEKDIATYKMIFETTQVSAPTAGGAFKIKGLGTTLSSATNDNTDTFISVIPDYEKKRTELLFKPVTLNSSTRKLTIDSKNRERDQSGDKAFNEAQTDNCKDFVEKLLTIPADYFSAANLIEGQIKKLDLIEQVKRISNDAVSKLRDVTLDEDETAINNFALCLYVWKQYDKPDDRKYIRQIDEIINAF